MMSQRQSDVVQEGLAALADLTAGKTPDAASLERAATALAVIVRQHHDAGAQDDKAEAAALLATSDRMRAELEPETARRAAFLTAYRQAIRARGYALESANRLGVNDRNMAAYVRATDETAQAALAAGQLDASKLGERLLHLAAEYFSEAAVGYRRLGRLEDARRAQLRAVEARGRHSLRSEADDTGEPA